MGRFPSDIGNWCTCTRGLQGVVAQYLIVTLSNESVLTGRWKQAIEAPVPPLDNIRRGDEVAWKPTTECHNAHSVCPACSEWIWQYT